MAAVNPVPRDSADASVHPIYDSMTKRLGFMPQFYGLMAHRPNVLAKFIDLYKAIMSEGTVEPRYKELAYLKTAQINGCEYCFKAHAGSGKKAGITPEHIQALLFYQRSDQFDEKEKATILLAERLTRGSAAMRDGSIEDLKKFYTEDQIVELVLVCAIANFTNRVNDGLRAAPDLG